MKFCLNDPLKNFLVLSQGGQALLNSHCSLKQITELILLGLEHHYGGIWCTCCLCYFCSLCFLSLLLGFCTSRMGCIHDNLVVLKIWHQEKMLFIKKICPS